MWLLCSGLAVCVLVTLQLVQGNQTSTFGNRIASYSPYRYPRTTDQPRLQASIPPPLLSTPKRLIDVLQPPQKGAHSGRQNWPYFIQKMDTKADVSFLYQSKKSPINGCGVPVLGRVRRIVGGTQAERCLFPWMVYISRDPGKDDLCGGTLVSSRHVITAAHCYDNLGSNWPVLYIGEYNRQAQANSSNTRFVSTSYKLTIHPKYSRLTFSYDIAVLKLNTPIDVEAFECMRPICLPEEQHFLRVGDTCTVAGWGSTSRATNTPVQSSPFLMKTQIRVLNESACKVKFGNLFNGHSQLCAGDLTGRTDSCVGDSGGPMMCSMSDPSDPISAQAQFLMGVISSGANPCAQAGTPALYTDIQKVRSWIRSVTKI